MILFTYPLTISFIHWIIVKINKDSEQLHASPEIYILHALCPKSLTFKNSTENFTIEFFYVKLI